MNNNNNKDNSGIMGAPGRLVDKVEHAAGHASESVKSTFSGASKEGNKEIAKGNTDAPLSERASAGASAIGDKFDESRHDTKASAEKAAGQMS